MSNIGNIGGPSHTQTINNISQSNTSGTGTVGNLGGHSVTQSQTAQTPARESGIGDKIANFFTNTLPKFFSSVGESISNFFSRLTAPAQQQPTPQPQPTGTTGVQQTVTQPTPDVQQPKLGQLSFSNMDGVQGDKTPLSQDDRDFLHKYVSDQIKSGHGDVGTFLRGNDEGSKRMGGLLLGLGTALSKDIAETLSDGGALGFHQGKGMLKDTSEGEQKTIVSNGVKVLKESWERMFGSDESSAKTAGARLPQVYKDIIAVGFEAIDQSDAPNKQGLKDKFLANLLLRGISPGLTNMGATSPPGSPQQSSLIELSKIVQNIANGIDIEHNVKETLHPDVMPQLGDFRAMKDNMLTAFNSTQVSLVLTMDDVKELTSRTEMPPLPKTPSPLPERSNIGGPNQNQTTNNIGQNNTTGGIDDSKDVGTRL